MLRGVIQTFDAGLRRILGIYDFTQDPNCILRTSYSKAPHDFQVDSMQIKKGEPVVGLHLWNERIPKVPETGPDLVWAVHTQRLFVSSLRLMAQEVKSKPNLSSARAVYCATVLFTAERAPGKMHPMERLGFTVNPYHSSLGRLGEGVENAYTWTLMWVFSPTSVRAKPAFGIRRTELWMPLDQFLQRYG